ncbi:MAG TPA: CAP domain-containing protein [Bryobacteraceae bacterium]|nr:CAP domain-containing protein [Bryobacteraceae bacterium]
MHVFWSAVTLALLMLQAGEATQTPREAAAIARRTFDGVNARRVQAGLDPLKWNDDLAAAAREHAVNMAGRDFFAHNDPVLGSLAERLNRRGIPWRMCAENIFMAEGYKDPVPKAVEDWMNSPGHRQNILEPRLTDSGVGTAVTASGRRYFVQVFTIPGRVADASGPLKRRKPTSSSR